MTDRRIAQVHDGPPGYFRRMLAFPYAKINLGLNVMERRADGYHEIESVLVPIPLRDALEIVIDPTLPRGGVVYTRTGLSIDGDIERDLCMRAVRSIAHDRDLPGLRMHLHKVVPMGAGLGGGSSDGAQALMLANKLLELKLDRDHLHRLAEELGSDCPFFLGNGAALVTGRGERISPITLDLGGLWLVLVNPGVHVSTALVYANTDPTERRMNLGSVLLSTKMEEWGSLAPNVMEHYVFKAHPEVGEIKQRLLEAGAVHAAMSGSGSTVFGLFRNKPAPMAWPMSHSNWVFQLPAFVQ